MDYQELVHAINRIEKDASTPNVDKKIPLKHFVSSSFVNDRDGGDGKLPGRHSSAKSNSETVTTILRLRQADGQCGWCGAQTHEIVTSQGLFRRTKKRIPLSIPDQVHRGRCLLCHPLPTATTAAPAVVKHEDTNSRIPAPIVATAFATPPTAASSVPLASAVYFEDVEDLDDFQDANPF